MKSKRDTDKCKKKKKCECGVEIRGFKHKLFCTECAKERHVNAVLKHRFKERDVIEENSVAYKKYLKRGLK